MVLEYLALRSYLALNILKTINYLVQKHKDDYSVTSMKTQITTKTICIFIHTKEDT